MQSSNPRESKRPRFDPSSERGRTRVLLAIALALITGCAGSSGRSNPSTAQIEPPAAESYENAPNWITAGCRAHWPDQVEREQIVCGIGSAAANRNRVAARDTAVARARSAIARSIEVTIESLVRLEDDSRSTTDGYLRSIVHQLSSASLPGCQVEAIWHSNTGAVHALVSLQVVKVQQSVRNSRSLTPAAREDLARRAADAFAQMNAALDSEPAPVPDDAGLQ